MLKIGKSIASLLIVGIIGLVFGGCAGSGTPDPELNAKQYMISQGIGEKANLSVADFYVKRPDGYIVLANGDSIMDPEGAIRRAISFKDKIYYLVKNENTNEIKIKDENGKLIKNFGVAYDFMSYVLNNKIYFGITTKQDSKIYNNVYSNLFVFDGIKSKLIKKSVVGNGNVRVGLFTKAWLDKSEKEVYGYTRGRGYNWAFFDVMTGKRNDIKPSLVPEGGYKFWGKRMGYKYEYMIGFVGDVAIYIYQYKFNTGKGTSSKYILEAQNMVTKKSIILTDNSNEKFSFLSNNKDVVFKSGNRIIDMATFRPATIDDNFKVLELTDCYSNMGGGLTKTKFSEYKMSKIYFARCQGKNLFVYR